MRPAGTQRNSATALTCCRIQPKGLPPVEVAQMVGVDQQRASMESRLPKERAPGAGVSRPACRQTARVPDPAIERELLRDAQAAGFATDLWTCPRVARLIAQRFNVHYHVDHIGRLLHSLGWSPQKPTRRAVRRDEEAIRRWIKPT